VVGGDVRRVMIGSNIDFLFNRVSSEVFSLIIATLDEMITCFLDTITGSIDAIGGCCSGSSGGFFSIETD
jgi:hypothetical protein